jgi:hypothetical protein
LLQASHLPRRRPTGEGRLRARRPTGHPRPRPQQRRTYLQLPTAEARCLTLAFYRFVELHGRALSWPPDACTLEAVACPTGDTVMLGLWSQRAASEFDRFWARYRLYFLGPTPPRSRTFHGLALLNG